MNLVLSTLAGLLALLALCLLVKPDNAPPPQPPTEAEQPHAPELPTPTVPFITTGLGGPWPPVTYCGGRCHPATPQPAARTAMTSPLDHASRTERKSERPSNSTNRRFTADVWDVGQSGCGSRSSIK